MRRLLTSLLAVGVLWPTLAGAQEETEADAVSPDTPGATRSRGVPPTPAKPSPKAAEADEEKAKGKQGKEEEKAEAAKATESPDSVSPPAQEQPTDSPGTRTEQPAAVTTPKSEVPPTPASASPKPTAATPDPVEGTPATSSTAESAPAAVPVPVTSTPPSAAPAPAAKPDPDAAPAASAAQVTPSPAPFENAIGAKVPATEASAARPLSVTALTRFRSLLVVDETPANDMFLFYALSVSAKNVFTKGLSFALAGTAIERFVAEPEESGFRIGDTLLSTRYGHSLSVLGEKSLNLGYALGVYFPTSRKSLNEDLYAVTRARTSARLELHPLLTISTGLVGKYIAAKYAERAGYRGGMLPQWQYGVSTRLSSRLVDSESFGRLSLALGTQLGWTRNHASRDDHLSASSQRAVTSQSFGWSVDLSYAPTAWVAITAAIEHGNALRRGGIINPDPAALFLDRDLTEMALEVAFSY